MLDADLPPVWVRRLVLVLGFPVGAALGVVGAFQHLRVVGPLPVAAVLAVAVLTVLVRLGALLSGRRLGAVLPLVGWVLVTLVFVVIAPGGDVVLTDSVASYTYLLGGVIVSSTAASLPPVRLPGLAAASDPATEVTPVVR